MGGKQEGDTEAEIGDGPVFLSGPCILTDCGAAVCECGGVASVWAAPLSSHAR